MTRLIACAVLVLSFAAHAFPTRPVRFIVPAAPGGGLDSTGPAVQKWARLIRERGIRSPSRF